MRWLARPTALGLFVGLIGGSSCIELNPEHCANSGVACADGLVCDRCAATNDGCVTLEAASSEERCLFESGSDTATATGGDAGSEATTDPVGAESSTSGGQSEGSSGASETGIEPECTAADGKADPACIEEEPLCVEGTCRACDQLSAGACAGFDSDLAACDIDSGLCVECTSNEECSGTTPVCTDANECRACVEHEDCGAALGCNLETGACLPAENVVYVQRDASNCPAGGEGTAMRPYCSLQEARDEQTADAYTIILMGTNDIYTGGVEFGDVTVAILGVDGPIIAGSQTALRVTAAARLFVDGVEISGSNGSGIECGSAFLWVDDSTLASNNGRGIDAVNCPVQVRRSAVRGNSTGGIAITDQPLVLQNSFVTLNGSGASDASGLRLEDSNASIVYSTLAYNNAIGSEGDAMACLGAVEVVVRNSIVWAEDSNESIACSTGQLTMERSVTDDNVFTGDTSTNTFSQAQPSAFVDVATGNLHLETGAPFEGIARWAQGDPERDIDGDPRPVPGPEDDYAGADVPRP